MTRERLVWVLALLGLVLGGWWLSVNTEWVDDTRPRSLQGEAKRNPVYAAEQFLRRLGMQASHHEALERLPPPGARLVLLSSDWRLHAGVSERLRAWVEQGGHLVLTESAGWDEGPLADWMPLTRTRAARDVAPLLPAPSKAVARMQATATSERILLISSPALWEGEERLSVCGYFIEGIVPRAAPATRDPAWSLMSVKQAEKAEDPSNATHAVALRLPVGRGSVTALGAGAYLLQFGSALRCDNPMLLAGLVQAEPGAEVWFYLHEEREALLPWLWNQAWVAIVLGLLALAAWLWRAAVRFGPRQMAASRPRRSIAEQVHGLAAFLNNGGREALLGAQQRALHEAALRRLPHLPSLRRPTRQNLDERAQALAQATGLPADALAEALSVQFTTRAALPRLLQLLETARRRLLSPESPKP